MRSLLFLVATSSVAFFYCACSSSSSSSDQTGDAGTTDASSLTDAGGDGSFDIVTGGKGLTLAVAPPVSFVVAGATLVVPVSRVGSVPSAVTVTVGGLPAGVTASALTIAPGQSSGKITLSAAPTAAATATPATITVTGKTAGATASASFPLSVHGSPGTLDTTWGSGGLSAGLGETTTQATGIAFQKSGLPVVGGYVGTQYAVARYTSAGVLDTTFGTAGKTYVQATSANNFISFANAIAIDNADAIYQAGSIGGGSADGQALKYLAAGTPDPTWGTSGVASVTSGQSLHALTLDSTGKLLIGGFDQIDVGCTYRFTSVGANDTAFGFNQGGLYCADTGVNTTVYVPFGLALQSTGRIIAAGNVKPSGQPSTSAFIGGITSTGAIDTSYGTSGYTLTSQEQWFAVAAQKDDAVVAAGYQQPDTLTKISVARFTKTGALDTSFNDTGIATVTVGDATQSAQANGVAVQSDGKIVVVGTCVSNSRSVMVVLRLNANGSLDTTFGPSGGILLIPVATTTAAANAVAIAPDGRIYVAGQGDMDFAVARIWP